VRKDVGTRLSSGVTGLPLLGHAKRGEKEKEGGSERGKKRNREREGKEKRERKKKKDFYPGL